MFGVSMVMNEDSTFGEQHQPSFVLQHGVMPDASGIDFKSIVDNMQEAFNILDAHGNMIYANQYAVENDIVPRKFLGHNIHELIDRGIIIDPASFLTITENKKITKEVRHYNGRTFMCISIPVFDEEKRLAYVVCITRDIDDMRDFLQPFRNYIKNMEELDEEFDKHRMSADKPGDVIMNSAEMKHILRIIDSVAPTSVPVLIQGESGVGKEELVKIVYNKSQRRNKPLLAVNCGSIPASLIESQLFGHEKGAFTSASSAHLGFFEYANGGTLFLDEIGELELDMQTKLLRVLQEKTIRRVGSNHDIPVDVRIIAATNKDLFQMVKEKKFRLDLFYRLNVISIEVPPLRKRREDLFHLITYFLNRFDKQYEKNHYITEDVWNSLMNYSWPGNIRELSNIMERLVLLSQEKAITSEFLPHEILENSENVPLCKGSMKAALEDLESKILSDARKQYGTCRRIAEALDMDYSSVARKLKKYHIQ